MVRPTGNALDVEEWKTIQFYGCEITKREMLGIHKLKIYGDLAYAVCTEHVEYTTYEEKTENKDVSVWSVILQNQDGWKICWAMSSSPRDPSEPKPEFDKFEPYPGVDDETLPKDLRGFVESAMRDMSGQSETRRAEDCYYIRPTGNPLSMKMMEEMMAGGDIKMEERYPVEVYETKLNSAGDFGFVCALEYGKFSYKETANEDLAVLIMLCQKQGDCWKIVHGHRSSGRAPTDDKPSFPNVSKVERG